MAAQTLDPRRKLLITVLVAAAAFSVYSRLIAAPIQKKTADFGKQIQKAETQLRDLNEKLPPVGELAARVAKLEGEAKSFNDEIAAIEKKLPSRAYTSRFIAQVTELAKEVKIESVKQRIEKEEVYSRLYLEIQFTSSYSAAVRYVAAVESITPYLKVEQMTITEPKAKAETVSGGSPMKLVVSCLLGDSTSETELKPKGAPPQYKDVRDLLGSKAKPALALRESEFHIEGITYNASNPTAIINGDVYRVGSEIAGYRVTAIAPDSVILSDGTDEHILNVSR